VFFHTALVQAVCSGFIAGQLGEGTLKDGAKHAAVLLALAYVAFILISSPVASVAAAEEPRPGEELTLESVSLSDGGFVAVHQESINGTRIGTSGYLAPGTHTNVTIELSRPAGGGQTLVAVPHFDTNGNEQFDYPGPPWEPNDPGVDHPYPTFSNSGTPGVRIQIETPDEEDG
jgi:flagellar protein FlaJ